MDNQTIIDNLCTALSSLSKALNIIHEDAERYLELEFDDEMVFDAMLIFGAIAKNVGYRKGAIDDENLTEKVNNLLRIVEDWTGKSYPKF